jgi:hypothetical protein
MRLRTSITAALLALLLNAGVARAALPSASTGGARNQTQTSVLLNGTINPNSEPTTYHFEYGPTRAYGSRTAEQGPTGATKGNMPVSASVDGLTPATTYHYRLVATNASGTRLGRDRTFKTLKPAPTVTLAASRRRMVFGGASVLAGQLTVPGGSAAGVRITLQQDPAPFNPQDFSAAGTTRTDAAGRFSFTQAPGVNTTYRVVAGANPRPTSAPVVVRVALKVTLSLSTAHPRRGKAVVFSGTVAPARNGQLVRIQKRVGRRWRTVKTGVLGPSPGSQVSAYRVKVRVRKRGVFRALVAGDVANVAGASRTRLIRPR